jgi:hypothetical protein
MQKKEKNKVLSAECFGDFQSYYLKFILLNFNFNKIQLKVLQLTQIF